MKLADANLMSLVFDDANTKSDDITIHSASLDG